MQRRVSNSTASTRSALRGLAWIGGAVASLGAVAIGTVLAVVFAATMVVIAIMASALLLMAGAAFKARRTVRAPADVDVIEARNVGGHSWVAYGWDDRR